MGTPEITRRSLLQGAVKGTAAAALTATGAVALRSADPVRAAEPARHGVFGYGVASGDPIRDAVIIWTRATPPGQPVAHPGSGRGAPLPVTWEVAADPGFAHVVRTGRVTTSAAHDHTVKVDVTGLQTYTRYWYRFRAAGQTSPVGATRTAPDEPGETHALRFAFVSCSNYSDGWFGAYRGLAARTDLDFVLHVGDYYYEYGNDHAAGGDLGHRRDVVPDDETLDLTDYRLRHALYKADPDLQAVHRAHPFITIFDDHEIANNMWGHGASNHSPRTEGSFADRRARAFRAYLEWMPIRLPSQRVPHRGTRFFRRFTFGGLADLSVLETRQNRSRQVDGSPYAAVGGYVPTGRHDLERQFDDPDRHLPEPEQLTWLERGLAMPRHWHLIGNQTVLTPLRFPGAAVGHPEVETMVNSDQWDGYRADQRRLIDTLDAQSYGDAVVLTGDIHSSWVTDIPANPIRRSADYRSAGVEFVCPSVTSNGYFETMRDEHSGDPIRAVLSRTRRATASIAAGNPWVRFLDGVGHGYVVVDVTPDRVQGDWHLSPEPTRQLPDPRTVRSVVPAHHASFHVPRGTRRAAPAAGPIGARADEPRQQPTTTHR